LKKNFKNDENLIKHIVSVRRVAKVVKGGRRFGFSALVVVGNGKGRVSYASGKAKEVAGAVKKATDFAMNSLNKKSNFFYLKDRRTIHHDVIGRFCASKVHIRTADQGTGIIASKVLGLIFEAIGIKDIVAKSIGSTNEVNVVKSAIVALRAIQSPRDIEQKRGVNVTSI